MTTPARTSTPRRDPSLHLPRILCLHGGGTNARIFRVQCRAIRSQLSTKFRLVFVDAPFISSPGPDVGRIYEHWGPFRSWYPQALGVGPSSGLGVARVSDSAKNNAEVIERIDQAFSATITEDNALGADGAWVGLLGFSQGAKVAQSLLLRQQERLRRGCYLIEQYAFGVIMSAPGPMLWLDQDKDFWGLSSAPSSVVLRVPTVQVYGTRDWLLQTHSHIMHACCEVGSRVLVEWDGDHQVPIKTMDVNPVVKGIMEVVRRTGVHLGV